MTELDEWVPHKTCVMIACSRPAYLSKIKGYFHAQYLTGLAAFMDKTETKNETPSVMLTEIVDPYRPANFIGVDMVILTPFCAPVESEADLVQAAQTMAKVYQIKLPTDVAQRFANPKQAFYLALLPKTKEYKDATLMLADGYQRTPSTHCRLCLDTPPEKLKMCAKCGKAVYCSKKCQVEDFEFHRVFCRALCTK